MVTMRNLLYGIAQMYPPKSKWSVDDMPDLTGKVAMVTGGNSGIGRETVKALLMHNAKVYLATRDEQKARKAIAELKVETSGKEAVFLKLDLADLRNIRSAAEEFLAKEQELHIVFANAAIMACPLSILTEQQHDIQFGTNVIGHYHLVTLLLPALARASELNSTTKSRVIFTSSSASYMSNGIEWDALSDNMALKEKGRKKVGPRGLYSMSKFGNIVLANELARRYGDKVVVMSCNPGNIKTELQRYF
ncbi:NAD-P-binding protein, partial [Stereum hirsutum FP-91666 SS1]|uniref:NAD-P-binding protein n=1 Tax=Stereum hirsutum (strain FP-91666) TaxID=721885 RepID=UPI000444A73E